MYLHDLGDQQLTVISPVRWVVAYANNYTLSDAINSKVEGHRHNPEGLKSLVVKNLTLAKLFAASPGLTSMLKDLRFSSTIETSEALGSTPFCVLTSDLPSSLPSNDVLKSVVQLAGKPVFEEVIDLAMLEQLTDPFAADVKNAIDSR